MALSDYFTFFSHYYTKIFILHKKKSYQQRINYTQILFTYTQEYLK